MATSSPIGYLLGLFRRPIPIHLGDVVTFGRDRQNSVPLDDALASRQHAAISCSPNGVVSIKDFGSTNKTWINDEAIRPKDAVAVENGTQIRIGGTVFSYASHSTKMEPKSAARKKSIKMTQVDTVDGGLRWKDGQIVEDGSDQSQTEVIHEDVMKTLSHPHAPVGAKAPALAGQLSVQSLPHLLQFLNQSAQTGELIIDAKGISGIMVFEKGNIVFAKAGAVEGEESVYACALKTEGSFHFNELKEIPVEPRNVKASMMQIVFECCKRFDDAERETSGQ